MKHRILFTEKFLDIEFNMVSDTIVANWHGKQTEASIKLGYEKILQFITEHYAKLFLDNHLEISGLWGEASNWVAGAWFDLAKSRGLNFMACVYSEHSFSNLSTSRVLRLINSPAARGFNDKRIAEQWLEDVSLRYT
jgi:hypothetical protein